MTHPRALALRKYMIPFSEALVVCTLYRFGFPPHEVQSVEEITNLIEPFIRLLNNLREFFEDQIREGEYSCYTNVPLLPIDSNSAISLIEKNETSNLLIRTGGLTPYGSPNNYLPLVIDNARAIIRNNPLLQECISYKGTTSSTLTESYEIGSPEWRSQNASAAANKRHDKPGGSRDKQQQIREIWATGKYTSRDLCAEQECAAIGMSISAARNALKNTPEPK